jgi:hypothetical protein
VNNDWVTRLTNVLEPVLAQGDPRPGLSAYHDMPFAIFRYPPDAEFALRRAVSLLATRLEQAGKRVTTISLSECLWTALATEGVTPTVLADAERSTGVEAAIETIHAVLGDRQPLEGLVAERVPPDARPERDIVLVVRAGALFPVYRTSSLLEQLKGRVSVPVVLFYPGELDGASGLRFMGVLEAEHNYRSKIF